MNVDYSEKLKSLPPYLFAKLDEMKKEIVAAGKDVIDLGVGDPDLPTDGEIIAALKKAAEEPKNHKYPTYSGLEIFRQEVANFMRRRFGVNLDPSKEITSLIGSKEGIAHFPIAFINPGDVVLCPDPAYPVYASGTTFAGGEPYKLPLLEENGFLPDLKSIPQNIIKRAKIIWVNYPNNPTSAEATEGFFTDLINFCHNNNIIACHDSAYSEVYCGKERPISILNAPGSKEVAIEFHSLSKTFNMTGWRIGWACGNERLVSGLLKVKTNIDSGTFQAVQFAAVGALKSYENLIYKNNKIYIERRKLAYETLNKMGFKVTKSESTFYVWVRVPEGFTSESFVRKLLLDSAIVVTPGSGFGSYGEGYFRISLTVETKRLIEAFERIKK